MALHVQVLTLAMALRANTLVLALIFWPWTTSLCDHNASGDGCDSNQPVFLGAPRVNIGITLKSII